jgi:hypothetical protein
MGGIACITIDKTTDEQTKTKKNKKKLRDTIIIYRIGAVF